MKLPPELYADFPNLGASEVAEKSSDKTDRYNCAAFAAGDKKRCWWPDAHPEYFWPNNDPETLNAFVNYFQSIGFSVCQSAVFEEAVEKLAIYAVDTRPKHVALQRTDRGGKWISKIGFNVDILHALEDLEGTLYGRPTVFMRRKRRCK